VERNLVAVDVGHAVCVTSGCHAPSLLGFNVNHHETTTANAPKTMASFRSFPRTNMTIVSSAITNKIAVKVLALENQNRARQMPCCTNECNQPRESPAYVFDYTHTKQGERRFATRYFEDTASAGHPSSVAFQVYRD